MTAVKFFFNYLPVFFLQRPLYVQKVTGLTTYSKFCSGYYIFLERNKKGWEVEKGVWLFKKAKCGESHFLWGKQWIALSFPRWISDLASSPFTRARRVIGTSILCNVSFTRAIVVHLLCHVYNYSMQFTEQDRIRTDGAGGLLVPLRLSILYYLPGI